MAAFCSPSTDVFPTEYARVIRRSGSNITVHLQQSTPHSAFVMPTVTHVPAATVNVSTTRSTATPLKACVTVSSHSTPLLKVDSVTEFQACAVARLLVDASVTADFDAFVDLTEPRVIPAPHNNRSQEPCTWNPAFSCKATEGVGETKADADEVQEETAGIGELQQFVSLLNSLHLDAGAAEAGVVFPESLQVAIDKFKDALPCGTAYLFDTFALGIVKNVLRAAGDDEKFDTIAAIFTLAFEVGAWILSVSDTPDAASSFGRTVHLPEDMHLVVDLEFDPTEGCTDVNAEVVLFETKADGEEEVRFSWTTTFYLAGGTVQCTCAGAGAGVSASAAASVSASAASPIACECGPLGCAGSPVAITMPFISTGAALGPVLPTPVSGACTADTEYSDESDDADDTDDTEDVTEFFALG